MKKIICATLCILMLGGCYQKTIVKNEINKKDSIVEKSFNESQNLLLDLHNKQRKYKNLKDLFLDEKLCEYAQKHAEKMAHKKYLYHSSMSNLIEVDDNSSIVGENIAWAQEDEVSVVDDWMNSSGHKSNILGKKFKKVGFGSAEDLEGNTYWCAVFSN